MELDVENESIILFGVTVPSLDYIIFTIEHCFVPTILQIVGQLVWLLIGTIGFNYLTKQTNNEIIFHILSIVFGFFMLSYIIFDLYIALYYVALAFYSYLLLCTTFIIKNHVCTHFRHYGYIVMAAITASMVLGEIYFPDSEVWFRLRGTAMILCMKVVTFGFSHTQMKTFSFWGYAFYPGNIIFGPWISYDEYIKLFSSYPTEVDIPVNITAYLSIYGIIMLLISNCVLPLVTWDLFYHTWLYAYIGALTFRTSHYFIMSLSELTMIASGYNKLEDINAHYKEGFTNPSQVELPRSMLAVVINWNIPVHKFLKEYVFKESIKLFGKFCAIFLTYFYSSLLHGINLEVGVVLLTLAIFSYVEMHIRNFLAEKLDACVRARPCPELCNHKYKDASFRTAFINDLLSLLTVVQLAYTGFLMHNRSETGSVYDRLLDIHYKWLSLGYFCHFMTFIMFIVTIKV